MVNGHNSVRSLLVAVSLALMAVLAWMTFVDAPSARAHAVQLASDPAPNEQLLDWPRTISISFNEPLEQSVTSVQLWDTSPAELPLSAPEYTTEDSFRVDIINELPPGIYTVIWRNLSTVDGHTWAGSFSFTVLNADGTTPPGAVPTSLLDLAQAPSNTPSTLETTARWIVLLGSAIMLGGVAYVMLVVIPASRVLSGESREALRKLSVGILVTSTAIAVFFVLQGSLIQLLVQADKLGGLGRTDELLTDTRFGKFLIARQAMLLVTLIATFFAWRAKGRALVPALSLLLVAAFGVLFTQSMVSHAAGSDGAFWKVSTDILHLVAASLWVGGLIHIGLAMPRWLDELSGPPRTLFAAASFRSFSILAAFSVLVLMISGVISAFAQFTAFGQLFDTNYGLSLVAKMVIVLPLLAVAGLNAFRLQPRLIDAGLQMRGAAIDAGDDDTPSPIANLQQRLVNTIRLEAVLAILVLVAVGVLTQLEPARAEAEADAASGQTDITSADPLAAERGYFLRAAQVGGLVVSLKVDPGQVGSNKFEVGLGSEFGGVGDIVLVRLDFEHPDAKIEASRLELPLSGSQQYGLDATNLSLPGEWNITATIRRENEEDIFASFDVPVGVETDGESSIWDWPFDGMRSTGVIIALSVGAMGLAVVATWQRRNFGIEPRA